MNQLRYDHIRRRVEPIFASPSQLPAWNDLPDPLRRGLVEIVEIYVGGSNVEDYAGQLAVDFYAKLAEGLPRPVFPLFQDRSAAHHG